MAEQRCEELKQYSKEQLEITQTEMANIKRQLE